MNAIRALILIIDDTPANLMTLGNALEPEFDLRIATSGALGLQLAAEIHPSLILLDVMMPDMDGFETCRRLKADPLLAGIPVVFVTAAADFHDESTGLSLGAADYITKPIHIEIARQRIRNLVDHERLRQMAEHSALQAAGQLAEMKRQFLQNISHELRTPLNGVIGLAGIGQRTNDLAKLQQLCTYIQDSGQQLLDSIEMILDFSALDHGDLRIDAGSFDLAALLQGLVLKWGARAEAKGLTFQVAGLPMAPMGCSGDAKRVTQVLSQLLSNAVKFTEQGSVFVSFQRDDAIARFTIADSGQGMTAEQLRDGFYPFQQVSSGLTRRFGGLGLGLALVKHLVELMGGSLHTHSQPPLGTTFTLTLPLPGTEWIAAPATAPGAIRVVTAIENKILALLVDEALSEISAEVLPVTPYTTIPGFVHSLSQPAHWVVTDAPLHRGEGLDLRFKLHALAPELSIMQLGVPVETHADQGRYRALDTFTRSSFLNMIVDCQCVR